MDNTVDDSWAKVARGARDALAGLGYPPLPPCLPDEAEACGGTWSQHAMAYLGTIKAVADHQLKHLGELGRMHAEVYWRVRGELEQADQARPADAADLRAARCGLGADGPRSPGVAAVAVARRDPAMAYRTRRPDGVDA